MRHSLLPEPQIDRNGTILPTPEPLPVVSKSSAGATIVMLWMRAQGREIVQGMMSRSKRSIAYPRTDSNDFDRPIRVTDIVLDLFE